MASRASSAPITQLSSRGLRNAPVKNTRNMWTMIEATKISADQWWICRMSRPPRTSNDRRIVEANASETAWPLQRGVGPVVGRHPDARDVEEGQEDARQQQDDEAVERDLTEHERPVVGEDLAGEELDALAGADPLVDEVAEAGGPLAVVVVLIRAPRSSGRRPRRSRPWRSGNPRRPR